MKKRSTTIESSSLEDQLAAIQERRSATSAGLREDYARLVLTLADGKALSDPAASAELLERVGVDERRLASDVGRIRRHRDLVQLARELPSLQAAVAQARAARDAAAEEWKATEARLREAATVASHRAQEADLASDEASQAMQLVLTSAPQRFANAYEGARQAVNRARAVSTWAGTLDAKQKIQADTSLVGVTTPETAARFAAALEAQRVAIGELREAEATPGAQTVMLPDGSVMASPVKQAVLAAQAEFARARDEVVAAARVASEEATNALPRLEAASAAALEAVLSADLNICQEG